MNNSVNYRPLSATCGLQVSPLALGSITFGGANGMEYFGHVDAGEASQLMHTALDAGINLIDTANYYSTGVAEEVVGEALTRSADFDRFLLTSKVRMVVGGGPNDGGASRWHILDQVDKSLTRLRRDHLDLYYLHEWDGVTPLEETLQTMDGLVRSGKIRYYGVSNFTSWQLMKVLMVCERNGFIKPVSQQVYYTPEDRDAEYEIIPAGIDQGIGTQVWSPLGMGYLTGKYRRGSTPTGTRMTDGDGSDVFVRDWDALYDLVDVLEGIASTQEVSIPSVVLAWLLGRPGVTNVAVGARSTQQLSQSLEALSLELADTDRAQIDEVVPPSVRYPFWHQAQLASDRLSPADQSITDTTSSQL